MTDKQKNLITRSITGVFYVAIMVVGLMNPTAMIFLFSLITGLAIWEFSGLVNERGDVFVNRFIVTVAGVYLFIAIAGINSGLIQTNAVFVPYLLTIVYLFVSELYVKSANAIHDWAYAMLSQMYIALPLSMVSVLAFRTDPASGVPMFYYLLPLSVFVFLWVNDSGAYCAGSLFGKHKLFPRVSPGKSWEGSIGGGIFVLVVAGLIGYFEQSNNLSGLNIIEWMGLGLVVVVFGTWGDLVESLFKRTLGIKDSGNILPGHGGMLDRFDSALMALPAAVIYLYTLTLI